MFKKLCFNFYILCVLLMQGIFSSANSVKSNVCSKPIETGLCLAFFVRYGYNSTENRCEEFVFGGCGNNGNNFKTLKECLSACKLDCLQPLETGECKVIIPRFGFSSENEKCIKFTYGGCNPNSNNFETIEECQAQCEGPKLPGSGIQISNKGEYVKWRKVNESN